ncbi:DUF2913 family protein [Acerihabitans arboris]|uniref:DUF2913 family protein n=1 Tax=Acerihabitans arboris TaxID=2691583 RepID=A0A845SSK7_9GAMM|nr:DUF2913 family protein [Acerihabitans arboris]NDL65836.1 DUF2913 family protein [Acerihabitans arboris]
MAMVAPGNTLLELAHFSWCAQVAVRLAFGEGRICSQLDEHLFLLSWMATAQKQKRFPKSIAMDISLLIAYARRLGIRANLIQQLRAIYIVGMSPLGEPTDQTRFNCVIESLRSLGWQDFSLSPKDWAAPWQICLPPTSKKNVLFIEQGAMDKVFDANGTQIAVLQLCLLGEVKKVAKLFEERNFYYSDVNKTGPYHLLVINTSPMDEKII